jgi:hypothetical protein
MKSLLKLIEELNQAALQSGLAHGTRGVSAANRAACDQAECDAAFAAQDRIERLRGAGSQAEVLELLNGDES